jgi:hypothetical protein
MKELAPALLKAQKEMGNAHKGSVNPFFKNAYASLNDIREACMPSLNRYGIIVLQPTAFIEGKNFIKTVLLHESGETYEGLTEIIYSKQNDAQAQGSGITYARRYGLQSLLNIGAEDDDAQKAVQPIKATAKEIEQALKNLIMCETAKDLSDLKRTTPAYIVADAQFIAAGKQRYELITKNDK